ncbi:Pentatricopeptide repeat [Macleaya cordata]|uniref:Pentatricopeptide repeat n=1 Tax=Macleaya cordata TaxID=56857 RepID=A0A200R420_MACCD|nr:Pentatricopeptide repeat [Macleaya cordata]
MIRAYALNGICEESLKLYIQMQYQGLQPDNFTYPFLLKACTDLNQGKVVHSLILKNPSLGSDIYSQTSLVGFYSSCGDIEYARSVFDKMPDRNVVSWTAMITGYVKQRRYNEGLALFHKMQIEGIEINEFTLVNVLSACAHLGAFEMGKWVHGYINRNRVFLNPTLATALIDMYFKCGYVDKASQVFDKLTERSVCTWNSTIGGLAMHGYGEEALERFKQMRMSGTKPDHITFIGVLSACTHSGMVEKGRECFYSMTRDYGIEPNIKHYGCFVDLLGRAGHLEEAYEIMKNMPIKPNGVLWGTLLNACSTHGNVELAEIAMEQLIELEPFNDGNYVIMSNIYAAKGQWENVVRMRRFMNDRGILKTPGCSSIEVNNVIHEFVVGDSRHPHSKEIYTMLNDVAVRLKAVGYVPKTSQVLLDANEEEKRQSLCHHSEKLAIAFGLVSTGPKTSIRVVKNLRACSDCHLATKLISKIYDREIIVRDRNLFHHFKDGDCSCKDYW